MPFQYKFIPLDQDEVSSPQNRLARDRRSRFRIRGLWKPLYRLCQSRPSTVCLALISFGVVFTLAVRAAYVQGRPNPLIGNVEQRWTQFPRLNGYYEGLPKLVPSSEIADPYSEIQDTPVRPSAPGESALPSSFPSPFRYSPYPDYSSHEYQTTYAKVVKCALSQNDDLPSPSVWAFSGVPENYPQPLFGSYHEIGLRGDVCFDRYGRYSAYGLGYESDEGGAGLGLHGDRRGTEAVLDAEHRIDWRKVDLGLAQKKCCEINQHRFDQRVVQNVGDSPLVFNYSFSDMKPQCDTQERTNNRVPRTAIVLRVYQGYEYNEYTKMYIRSLVSELNINSGGEYDVHLLVEVKDLSKPIWTSQHIHDDMLNVAVPAEFRSMATLWSETMMQIFYPGPFEPAFAYHGPIHWVVRSMHFALQWFALQHPEYDYFWEWEMDARYTGHYYELFDKISRWAKHQPRTGAWERNGRFYIPSLHGDWSQFSTLTQELSSMNASRPPVVSGPVVFPGFDMHDRAQSFKNFTDDWTSGTACYDGIGEDADFISLDPMFDPEGTDWLYRYDVSGYDTSQPVPPRRASIVTTSRLSRRLLQRMHEECSIVHHSMASEMFPATMALHHGFKAVFAPHPVFFDREWPAEYADSVFNGGPQGATGGYLGSVFGGPQHNLHGSTFYYNSGFAGALWRRWLGYRENGEGGEKHEMKNGRMCLRSTLLHPIKGEEGSLR